LTAYLNDPVVQKAMHTKDIEWQQCSSTVNYSYEDLLASMLPVYEELLEADITMLVYSGDVDGIVPVTGTINWLNELDLPVVKKWAPWTDSQGQVGGYKVTFDGLIFMTIRDAGHMTQ
jgi:serine carboxypeptidase-like clade 2